MLDAFCKFCDEEESIGGAPALDEGVAVVEPGTCVARYSATRDERS